MKHHEAPAASAQREPLQDQPDTTGSEPWPSPARAWYAVAIFALVLMLNFLDRGIINLMVEPIKADLELTDTQISLVMGFAFVIFYMLVGLPIARLVDTRSRRLIIGIGIACWSGMTAVCGLAQNFWQLFAARIGVGVGEACNGPATYSMLADLFPKNKLPRAIAVMNFGFAWGQGLALIVGGSLLALVAALPAISLPGVGTLAPWQMTFVLVGIPGLLIAALMRTVEEPLRRGRLRRADGTDVAPQALPVREVLAFLVSDWKTYFPMFIGMGLKTVLSFGNASWAPAFYIRTFDWTPAKVGLVTGTLWLIVAPLGLFAGSRLAEYWAKQGRDDANLRVLLLATWLAIPFSVLFPLMPTAETAIAMAALANFTAMLGPGPQNAAIQIVTPNQMRGQITALYLFVFNVIGFGLGPTFVALFTDFVFGDPAKLGYAIATAAAIVGPLAGLLFWYALKPYARSVVRARAWG